jgi:hypothetical protein
LCRIFSCIEARSLLGRNVLSQSIEKIVFEKRIITISYLDDARLRRAAKWRLGELFILLALIFLLNVFQETGDDRLSILGINAITISCVIAILCYAWWVTRSLKKLKEAVMKQNGWDGVKPVEMRVFTSDTFMH